jgi:hypothetical protein
MSEEKIQPSSNQADRNDGDRGNDHRGNDNQDHRERPGEPPGRIIHPKPTHGDSAVRARLAKSRNAMMPFSEFSYEEVPGQRGPVGIWTGRVRPFQAVDGLRLLLDDLAHDRPVFCQGSQLHHLDTCAHSHCGHGLPPNPAQLIQDFDVRIIWGGDEALPRAFIASPLIPQEKKMHMWSDGAVCAFLASDRVWTWHTDTISDFVPHVLIWLAKWMVYNQTNVWIGSEHGNTPQYHLEHVHPKAPCWCGRGRQYRKCHRPNDLVMTGQGKNRLLRC